MYRLLYRTAGEVGIVLEVGLKNKRDEFELLKTSFNCNLVPRVSQLPAFPERETLETRLSFKCIDIHNAI